MVDAQRSELLVGTLQVEQQTSKRNKDGPEKIICQSKAHGGKSVKNKGIAKLTWYPW